MNTEGNNKGEHDEDVISGIDKAARRLNQQILWENTISGKYVETDSEDETDIGKE